MYLTGCSLHFMFFRTRGISIFLIDVCIYVYLADLLCLLCLFPLFYLITVMVAYMSFLLTLPVDRFFLRISFFCF